LFICQSLRDARQDFIYICAILISMTLFSFPFPLVNQKIFPFPWDSHGNPIPTVIPIHTSSSHRRHRHLSCLVSVRGVNWIGDKSKLSVTKNFEMRCELSLVLSWLSFQFATWLHIVTSYLETGSRLVHKRVQTCSLSNTLTVANSVHTGDADETTQSCLVGGVNWA